LHPARACQFEKEPRVEHTPPSTRAARRSRCRAERPCAQVSQRSAAPASQAALAMYPLGPDPALMSGMHGYPELGHMDHMDYVLQNHAYWSHMQRVWHMEQMGSVAPVQYAFDRNVGCSAPGCLALPDFLESEWSPPPEERDAMEVAVAKPQAENQQRRPVCTKSKLRKQRRQRLRQAIQAATLAENTTLRSKTPLLQDIRSQGHEAFIREHLCEASEADLEEVRNRVRADVRALASDASGHHVFLHLLESAGPQQKQVLIEGLFTNFTVLACDISGCRVLQRALEVATRDQQVLLANGLQGQLLRCAEHQHANFVVQKCIEQMGASSLGFVLQEIQGHVKRLAQHEYGCRVLQRLFEFWSIDALRGILDEVQANASDLSANKFGNYVVQQVLQHGTWKDQQTIITRIASNLSAFSKNKFSSRVVEKCLETVHSPERAYELCNARQALISALLEEGQGPEPLMIELINDQFGNYVVQQAIRSCENHEDLEHWQLLNTCTALTHSCNLNRHAEATIAVAEAVVAKINEKKTASAMMEKLAPLSHGG